VHLVGLYYAKKIHKFSTSALEAGRAPRTHWVGPRTGLDASENRKILNIVETELHFPGLLFAIAPGLSLLLFQLHTSYCSLPLRLV